MARPPKYPGLQQRFESALKELLAGGSLKAREVIDAVKAGASKYRISDAEADDIDKNFANYAARAKEAGLITSSGPWGGYQLTSSDSTSADPGTAPAPTKPLATPADAQLEQNGAALLDAGGGVSAAKKRRHWESFLHLPLTVVLSSQFSGRVSSLPNASDAVRWGNPDMLMLRPSPLMRVQDYDEQLDPELLGLVDVTPECILASIEVKGGLDRNRAHLFTAIAEAAANSRWANEAWLVFMDWTSTDEPLAEDVLSLARSVEVGLIEVQLLQGKSEPSTLRTIVHHPAPVRATLRIGELTQERVGVLREAQSLLKEWQSGAAATFLDVDFAKQKARVLIQQALENVRRQKGFIGDNPFSEFLAPLRKEDAQWVADMLQATLRATALAADVPEGTELVSLLTEAGDDALVKKQADALRAALSEFPKTNWPSNVVATDAVAARSADGVAVS